VARLEVRSVWAPGCIILFKKKSDIYKWRILWSTWEVSYAPIVLDHASDSPSPSTRVGRGSQYKSHCGGSWTNGTSNKQSHFLDYSRTC